MKPRRGAAGGFSLVEVLIAVVVLGVGLLGLSGLQALGLKSNHSAYLRSQATVLAYDMLDRMRANRGQAVAGSYEIALASSPPDAANSVADGDLIGWFALVGSELPGGDAAIACSDSDATDGQTCTLGSTYTVSIQWDDLQSNGSRTSQTFAVTSQL